MNSSSMLEATYDSNQDLLNLVLSMVRQLSDRWMSQLAWVTGAQHGVMWTIRHSPAHEGGGLVDGGFDEKEDRRISLRERLVMFFSTMIFNTTCRLGSFDTSLSVSIQKVRAETCRNYPCHFVLYLNWKAANLSLFLLLVVSSSKRIRAWAVPGKMEGSAEVLQSSEQKLELVCGTWSFPAVGTSLIGIPAWALVYHYPSRG